MSPTKFVILFLCSSLHHIETLDNTKVSGLQTPLSRQRAEIHLLCQGRETFQRELYSLYERPHQVISWCMDWTGYAKVLDTACQDQRHVIVVISSNAPKRDWLDTSEVQRNMCSNIEWRVMEVNKAAILQNGRRMGQLYPELFVNDTFEEANTTSVALFFTDGFFKGQRPWSGLSGTRVQVACVILSQKAYGNTCSSLDGNTLVDAFEKLNVTVVLKLIQRGLFTRLLRSGEVDIVASSVGLTALRYKHFDFTVNKFGQAVYFVQKKWKHQTDFVFSLLPWTSLLALSMVFVASSFALLNIRHGSPPMSGMGGVVLALVAYTLSFTSPLRGRHATSTTGRVVMGFWMLAGFSLAAYTRSLLTASLMVQPAWDADDTLDKMLPKLQQGHLLPCAETNSFFEVLLSTATGNASGVVNAMAKSAKRWARSKEDFTGTIQSCLERTRSGTHVFFSGGIDPCRHSKYYASVALGQEPIRTLVGGFPVRRDYERRSELIALVRRTFETGWDLRYTRFVSWNCSRLSNIDDLPVRVTVLFQASCVICAFCFVVLFFEVLCSRFATNHSIGYFCSHYHCAL